MSLVEAPSSNVAGSEAQGAFLKPMPSQRKGADALHPALADQVAVGSDSSTFTRLFPLEDSSEGVPPTSADVAGLRLSHFVIEERIGRGGMGAVFRAVDQQLDRVVALKVLSPEHSRNPGAVQRFHNEARAAARLDHENIARAFFFGEDQGLQFIAFEFVRGTNIRDFILQKGMLTPTEVVNYALQIAQALRHTHAAGVVHRDIKPSNIIVTPSGRAKLVDLGLARQDNDGSDSPDLTVAGTTLGTFDYIAPEQARDPRSVDVRADIYSLGCTLYHMLTGEPPFPSGSMIQKVVDHHRGVAPDPAALNPSVPPRLSRIVRKMMASNPDERHATPDQLISDLATVAQSLGFRPEHPDGLTWAMPSLHRPSALWLFWHENRAWLLTIAALLVIVAGIHRIPWEQIIAVQTPPGPIADSDPVTTPSVDSPEPETGDVTLIPPLPEPPMEQFAIEATQPRSVVTDSRVALESDQQETLSPARSPEEMTTDREPNTTVTSVDDERPDDASEGESTTAATSASLGAFVVMDTDQRYPSLEAACVAAPKDARIEIRFDEPDVEWNVQVPIVIGDKNVVISAQPGTRPRLVFTAPVQIGLNTPTQMIRVRQGSLQLNDVDLVMDVKNIPADDDWALIVLDQANSLRMRGVNIRVNNPDAVPASMIELAEPTDADLERMNLAMDMRHLVLLDLEDCMLTGRCDLLRQNTIDPATISLDNVAAALRGTLFRILGNVEGSADPDQLTRMDLRHVTAVLEEGLMRVDTQFASDLLPMDVTCEASLLLVHPDEPLIRMFGHQTSNFLRDSLQFRDTYSYFNLSDPAWVISADVFREEIHYEQFGSQSDDVLIGDPLVRPVDWNLDRFSEFQPEDFVMRSGSTDLSGAFVGARPPVLPSEDED